MYSTKVRTKKGSALADFAPSLTIFLAVFIPLVHFGIFPIRLMLAHSAFESLTHDISMVKKRSSIDAAFNKSWQQEFLKKCGIGLRNTSFDLSIKSTVNNQSTVIQAGKSVPALWLPGGANYPCVYRLIGKTTLEIQPVLGADGNTGLLSPVDLEMSTQALWENLEFDPETGKLYLDE